MKFIRPDGRVLADIGEERKQKLYERLLKVRLTFKDWLIKATDKFIESEEK